MRRLQLLQTLNDVRESCPVITGPGLGSRILFSVAGDDPSILYNMEMQYATPMCMGLAMADPKGRRFIALEGDGSMLSGLGVLTTVARYQPRNLVIVVVDNGSYATFGRATMRSATADGIDLARIAKAAGLENTRQVDTVGEFQSAMEEAMSLPGPWFIVSKVEPDGDTDPSFRAHAPDVVDQAVLFRLALESEGSK